MKKLSNIEYELKKKSVAYEKSVYIASNYKQEVNPFRFDPGRKEKIKLNFYFHTSLWYFKRFYEGLKGLKVVFMKKRLQLRCFPSVVLLTRKYLISIKRYLNKPAVKSCRFL